jgi:hypothetical protein
MVLDKIAKMLEKLRKTPPGTDTAKTKTARLRKTGKKAVMLARMKLHFKRLQGEIDQPKGTSLENWDYKFTDTDRAKLKKALGISLRKNASNETIVQNIGALSLDQLLFAQKKEKGSLGRLFGRSITRKKNKDEYKPMAYREKFELGKSVEINLKSNQAAYDKFGLKAFTAYQPDLQEMYVYNLDPDKGRHGTAVRGKDGHFYWKDTGGYAAIYWAILTPTEFLTKKQLKDYGIEEEPDWDNMTCDTNTGFVSRVPKRKLQVLKRSSVKTPAGTGKTPKYAKKQVRAKAAAPTTVKKTAPGYIQRTPTPAPPPSVLPRGREKLPNGPLGKVEFRKRWAEIKKITNKENLWKYRQKLRMHPRDPLVVVPGTSKYLRSVTALYFGIYQQYLRILSKETGKKLRVYLGSGYRSKKTQQGMWDRRYPGKLRKNRAKFPNLPEHKIASMTKAQLQQWMAFPGGSPHNTGGAMDVSIVEDGKYLTGFKFKLQSEYYKVGRKTLWLSSKTVWTFAQVDENKKEAAIEESYNYQKVFLLRVTREVAEKKIKSWKRRRYLASKKMAKSKTRLWLRARDVAYLAKLDPDKQESALNQYLEFLKQKYTHYSKLKNLSKNDQHAIKTRKYLDEKYKASKYLGKTYYREGWHHNKYRDKNGKRVYRNI